MKFYNKMLCVVFITSFFAVFNLAFAAMAKNHDGEIIAYMEALNNHEIAVAKVAKDKKVDSAVSDYADMMIDQHGQNLKDVTNLSSQINVPADETAAVKKFGDKGEKGLEKLTKLDGASFQKAYIQGMIAGHKDAKKLIGKFVTEAQNSELKQYLISTGKVVQIHLDDAEKLK